MRDFVKFFVIQFFQYGLLAWNYRVIAQGHYISIGLSDLIIGTVNFFLIKEVAKVETKTAWAGYALGGMAGAVVSVFLTKLFYGQ